MRTNSEADPISQSEREEAATARSVAREIIDAMRHSNIVVAEFINQQSAARYCGYSEQFFNKICRAGNGPRHVMVGRRWRTRRAWLDQYMESGGPHGSEYPGGK